MKHSLITALLFTCCLTLHAEELDPAEIMLGERLFMETRFAQFFAAQRQNIKDINTPLKQGDPALEKTTRFFGLPPYQIPFADGPYAGQSFNCRTCHLVDEHLEQSELGMRSYADFAARSPLPTREDGRQTTVRNTPALVDVSLARNYFMLHFDGEFSSLDELIRGTLTDRNMGWLPGEKETAKQHICAVIREDDGNNSLAKDFGGYAYKEVFIGTTEEGKKVADEYLVPESLRIDVVKESCEDVFSATAKFIAIYIEDLVFSEDESIISPYDLFLKINNLPTNSSEDESKVEYSQQLIKKVDELDAQNKLKFVTTNPNTENGKFQFHNPSLVFEFGEEQLAGMRIFFSQTHNENNSVGNCIACHAAPHFTNFGLHNTGITQIEYDAIHGHQAFNRLKIPKVNPRDKKADLYLPATHKNPQRKGIFRSVPTEKDPLATDLGAWNILFNSDYPLAQESIYSTICLKDGKDICASRDDILQKSIARFKTPSLRNLGHSEPYMHNGQISDLHAVMSFYLAVSINTRENLIRNPDENIAKIQIKPQDIEPLVAFLESLNEDYN